MRELKREIQIRKLERKLAKLYTKISELREKRNVLHRKGLSRNLSGLELRKKNRLISQIKLLKSDYETMGRELESLGAERKQAKASKTNNVKKWLIPVTAVLAVLGIAVGLGAAKGKDSTLKEVSTMSYAAAKAEPEKSDIKDAVRPVSRERKFVGTDLSSTPSSTPESLSDIYTEAEEIYNKEFSEVAKRLNVPKEQIINDIINIRNIFYLAGAPENEKYKGLSTIEYYMARRVELYGNAGNPADGSLPLISVNYASQNSNNLSYDEKVVNDFMAKYDFMYKDIYADLNSKNYTKAEEEIKALHWMLVDDFVLGGLYSGINPYSFRQEYLAIAFGAAIDRYTPVAEYAMENQICMTLCINQETGETENVNVLSVIQALTSKDGRSADGKIVLDQLNDEQTESLIKIFNKQLDSIITYNVENAQTRILG